MKILNIFWAIVIFSLVVIIHEFGHYFFARKGGIKVNEFSLGMGPRLFSFDAAGTKWSVKLLPIGGSCMMEGEDEASDDEGAFANKSVWVRIWTVFGGPLFNFILAFVLSLFVIGAVGVDKSSIVSVISGYPAQQAGLRAGDVITKINGSHINLGREVSSYFVFHPLSDKDVTVEVKRGSEKLSFDVKPQEKERFYLGFTYSAGDGEARIDTVTDDGSLKEAGAKSGDVITAVNGTEIKSGTELSNYFNASPLDGKEVKLTLKKVDTGNTEEITVTPKSAGSSYTLGLVSNTAREKVGIVGVNGAGKSTFFKVIMKRLDIDEGKIIIKEGYNIDLIPQVLEDEVDDLSIDVFSYLESGRPIKELEEALQNTYNEIAQEESEKKQKLLFKKVDKIEQKLQFYRYLEAEEDLLKIIYGMKIDDKLLSSKLSDISVGQKSKITFARVLYSSPQIMLLDEPTNHLDEDTKTFVTNYLKNYNGSVYVISHDIDFLNEITTKTLFIDKRTKKIELFDGNYDNFIKLHKEREKTLNRLIEKEQEEEKKLKNFIDK